MIKLALYEPEIPPNTGNIIRLAVNIGCELHLIEPLGFSVDDRQLKRAGLDYHDQVQLKVHASLDAFLATTIHQAVYAITTKGSTLYTDISYKHDDVLLFGPETRGLPDDILKQYPMITIPMLTSERSLNLANAVSIVAYEAWRQLGFKDFRA
jgi:tRNA (cytidine/uridine-2'-O-)-methyltransferase